MSGCHDARNAVTILEVPCPQCGEIVEVFERDGAFAVDAICEECGYSFEAGESVDRVLGPIAGH